MGWVVHLGLVRFTMGFAGLYPNIKALLWQTFQQEPYYFGAILGSLIFGNSHIWCCPTGESCWEFLAGGC